MRPSKKIKFPPPLYLSSPGTRLPYCHTCGRVNSPRRSHKSADPSTPVKFCSDRCRRSKVGPVDRQIEDAFIALLEGRVECYVRKYGTLGGGDGVDGRQAKLDRWSENGQTKHNHGEPKNIVFCSEVEAMVFWQRSHREKVKMSGTSQLCQQEQDHSTGRESTLVSPAWDIKDQKDASINCEADLDCLEMTEVGDYGTDYTTDREQKISTARNALGDKKTSINQLDKTDDLIRRQKQGQRWAEEREMVRRAARRGVAFGFEIPDLGNLQGDAGHLKKNKKRQGKDHSTTHERQIEPGTLKNVKFCEAVIITAKTATVVEASFAKGDWGVRWRGKESGRPI